MPSPKMLEPLLLTAAAVGVDLDISTSKALADSLDRAVVSTWLFASGSCYDLALSVSTLR